MKQAFDIEAKVGADPFKIGAPRAEVLKALGEVPDSFMKNQTTVIRHLNDYLQHEKLKPENGGSVSRLPSSQTDELIEQLTEHTYHHTHQIVAHVLEHYGIQYSIPGMNKWLHQHGFRYKSLKVFLISLIRRNRLHLLRPMKL